MRNRDSLFLKVFDLFRMKDKQTLVLIAAIQIVISFLDLIGIAALGLLSTIAFTDQLTSSKPKIFIWLINIFRINNREMNFQTYLLGSVAISLLLVRTGLSIFVTRKTIKFLSIKSANLTKDLVSQLLNLSIVELQNYTSQQTIYNLTIGVQSVTMQVVASAIVLVSDFSLLFLLGGGLFFLDFAAAIITLLTFLIVGVLLHKIVSKKGQIYGLQSSKLNIKSNEKLSEIFMTFRELFVKNRQSYYLESVGLIRNDLGKVSAKMMFLPYFGKYLIETSIFLGTTVLLVSQIVMNDSSKAIVALTVFLAAGMRIAPAVLRVQQGLLQIRVGLGVANPTLDLIAKLKRGGPLQTINLVPVRQERFSSEIVLHEISFRYSSQNKNAINRLNLHVLAGEFVAVIGPSGAGKSTLVDLMLGLVPPSNGQVLISGVTPSLAIQGWPGKIAYVPQDIVLIDGTIRENVSLGYPASEVNEESVKRSIELAALDPFVKSLPNGLSTRVGENGARLSGGQKQRIGIARALYSDPEILILDEATSALDIGTESEISTALSTLHHRVTLVVIAHRLSTIRNADKVVYIDNGEILGSGTFNEIKKIFPHLEEVAR